MIQRKLSKRQGYMVQVIAAQLAQLQAQATDAQGALNEHAELLRAYFKLPDGEVQFAQGPDGWELRVTPAPKPKVAGRVRAPETDEDGDVIESPDVTGERGPAETKAVEEAEIIEAA